MEFYNLNTKTCWHCLYLYSFVIKKIYIYIVVQLYKLTRESLSLFERGIYNNSAPIDVMAERWQWNYKPTPRRMTHPLQHIINYEY